MKVAVIGSGIAGLSAAYFLSRRHEVHVFEKDRRIGGHTHTVTVESSAGPLAVDTGFIVHNDRTYPNLVRLLRELGVETQPSDMSFGVSMRDGLFEYSSRGPGGYFAQRSNLLNPAHYRLFYSIVRFNREAPKLLDDPASLDWTLAEVMERGRYPRVFLDRYLYPMAAAVWSMPASSVGRFPARTLIRFFANHGMLGLNTHPQWKVIRGGSAQYLGPLTAPFRERISTGVAIRTVERDETGATLHVADRGHERFDEVVFACHGNQVLPLLAAPTETERAVLGCFTTSRNEVCLHTDSTLLPRRPAARASWNYHLEDGAPSATLTYHMNRLQNLDVPEDYCVTLNGGVAVDEARILRRLEYSHPLYTREAVAAQGRWAEISGRNHTHFCGAYWHYGFHEDGLNSALRVARALGVDW